MNAAVARITRWRPLWKPERYVLLRNVSEHNIPLHLPAGRQRLDRDRTLLVTAAMAQLPEVRQYVEKGWLTVEPVGRKK